MKGEEWMSFDMNEKEMVNNLIDKYADLQRIKKHISIMTTQNTSYMLLVGNMKKVIRLRCLRVSITMNILKPTNV